MSDILVYNQIEQRETCDIDLVYIDQSPCESFNLNEAGWPRNDISAYELASTESEAALLLSKLQEIESDSVYKDMTEEEMFNSVCPRGCMNDPVLYQRFVDKLANVQYERLKAVAKDEEEKILKVEQDEQEFKAKVAKIAAESSNNNIEPAA